MKRAILIASLLIIFFATLIIAFFILPKGKSEILLEYYRKDYQIPLEKFQTLYNEGDHSLSVINPLIDLYLDHAEPGKAIHLLQEFNQAHPRRMDVLKSLSSLYIGSDKPDLNLIIQEQIYDLKPSKSRLEFLIANYRYKDEVGKWEKYLVELTSRFRAEHDAYEQLALYYAAQNEFTKALATLDRSFEVCKDMEECSTAGSLKMSILIDQDHVDQALAFALDFLQKKGGLTLYPDFVQLLLNSNHPDEAYALLETIPFKEQFKPDFIEARINTLAQLGEKKALLDYLKKLNLAQLLTESQLEVLISLSLTEESDSNEVMALLNGNILKKLPEDLWFSLVDFAIESQNRNLIQLLQKEVPESMMLKSPVLIYAIELGSHSPPTKDSLAFYFRPDLQPLTPEETARLAILYHQLGLSTLSQEMLKELANFENISLDLIPQLASLYWDPSLREDGYDKINSLIHEIDQPSDSITASWIALSILTGRDKQVNAWIELNQEHLNQSGWILIFEAYEEIEENKKALQIASMFQERFPGDQSQAAYAKALVLNHQYNKGITLLQDLLRREARIKDLLSELLFSYAMAEESELFDNALTLSEQKNELTRHEWLSLGYRLEEKGKREPASQVFISLVNKDGPTGAPIDMLLYIWGDQLTKEQALWLFTQGHLATGKDKDLILSALINAHYFTEALALISPEELDNPQVFKHYLLALSGLKEQDLILEAVQSALKKNPSIGAIREWAKLLEGQNADRAEIALYLAILDILPDDQEALKALGNLYFDQGSFCLAKWYLGKFLVLNSSDSLSLFHYAELYQRKGDYFHARGFYRAAINNSNENSPNDLQITATSYYRLNYPFTAIHLLQQEIETDPQSAQETAVSLAAILLELDCTEYAVPYLFYLNYDKPTGFNLENLRANYYLKANRRNDAFLQSDYVLDRFPEEPYAWSLRGLLEYESGRFRESLDYYDYASALKPEDEGLSQASKEIIDQHRSFTGLGWEYKKTGFTQIEHISRIQQAYNPVPFSRILFLGELDRFHIRSYTNDQTGLADQSNSCRSRYTLSWIHDFYNGFQSYQDLYAASQIFGGGSHFTYFDRYGSTEVAAELRRPNWDFPETIVEYGSRDRIYVQRNQKLFERIDALLKIEGRRYHLQHSGSKAAESIAWLFDVSYTLPKSHWMIQMMGHDSNAVFNYNIDAELGTWIKRKYNAEGALFYPLAVGKREIHTMEMQWSKVQYRYCRFFAHFGFSYDRFGGVNKALAVYGASLLWDKRPGLTFEALYDHSPSPSVTGANQDRLILNWIYYY